MTLIIFLKLESIMSFSFPFHRLCPSLSTSSAGFLDMILDICEKNHIV